MTAPEADAGAAQRDRTSRHLNSASLILGIIGLGLAGSAAFMDGRVQWPSILLPFFLIAQSAYGLGWFRRWPTVQRVFPAVLLVVAIVILVSIVRWALSN